MCRPLSCGRSGADGTRSVPATFICRQQAVRSARAAWREGDSGRDRPMPLVRPSVTFSQREKGLVTTGAEPHDPVGQVRTGGSHAKLQRGSARTDADRGRGTLAVSGSVTAGRSIPGKGTAAVVLPRTAASFPEGIQGREHGRGTPAGRRRRSRTPPRLCGSAREFFPCREKPARSPSRPPRLFCAADGVAGQYRMTRRVSGMLARASRAVGPQTVRKRLAWPSL